MIQLIFKNLAQQLHECFSCDFIVQAQCLGTLEPSFRKDNVLKYAMLLDLGGCLGSQASRAQAEKVEALRNHQVCDNCRIPLMQVDITQE